MHNQQVLESIKSLDPFTPVEIHELGYRDGGQSMARGIRIQTREAIVEHDPATGDPVEVEPAMWREIHNVSPSYQLFSNQEVVELANRLSSSTQIKWRQEKQFWNGKQFVLAMVAENGPVYEAQVGDHVGLGMMFENSYDGKISLGFSLFALRLVCKNGLRSRQYFRSYRFKHTIQQIEQFGKEFENCRQLMAAAPHDLKMFCEASQSLQRVLSVDDLCAIRSKYLDAGRISPTLWGKVVDKFMMEEEYQAHTGWDLLNAGTNVLWHNPRQTLADFGNNTLFVDNLLEYGLSVN